eukprot:UN00045
MHIDVRFDRPRRTEKGWKHKKMKIKRLQENENCEKGHSIFKRYEKDGDIIVYIDLYQHFLKEKDKNKKK